MKLSRLFIYSFGAVALTACLERNPHHAGSSSLSTPPASKPVAIINGQSIGEDLLRLHVENRRTPGAAPDTEEGSNTEEMLQELINLILLGQAAQRQGIQNDAEVAALLEHQRLGVLANALLTQKFADAEIPESELQTEYAQHVAEQAEHEFHARHILLETEDAARTVIGELNQGGDFSELAKQKSTGPSGPSGGDLGWFQLATMVPPFSAAVETLSEGEFTKQPVKTRFGWHVILLEGKRQATAPEYEAIKQQLRSAVINRRYQALVTQLREDAQVEIIDTASE